LAIALAAFAGEAAAQIYSAPYPYPPAGYRGVPVVPDDDDDDDVITADPDDSNLPAGRAPLARSAPMPRSDSAPYPYDPRFGRPVAPIPEAGLPSERYGSRNIVPPFYGTMPPYDERRAPDAGYGARPSDNGLPLRPPAVIESNRMPADITPGRPTSLSALPLEDQPEEGEPKELPPHLKRQVVDYLTREPAGSIIIDTNSTYLYYVLGGGRAMRYGIGVGREGFTWAGTEKISKVAEWPDWHPPAEMIERQPYLPRFMAGGPGNPLGARALYLGKTIYRIHGTNQPSTIGKFVSSGCIRMLNDDVEDLYNRVRIGSKVVVLPGGGPAATTAR
jgi:lipoprotein-anchoring transpeptidase ErfK/SrfK